MTRIKTTRLEEVFDFINGDRGNNYPSKSDFREEGIPFISSSHLSNGRVDFELVDNITEKKFNSLRSGKVQKNDILYCLRGSLGKKAFVDFSRGAIASSLVILRAKKSSDARYLYYALSSNYIKQQEENIDNGSVQGNLSVNNIKDFEIPLPDLKNRKFIADVLNSFESKIELNVEISKKLETLAKIIYDYWFVQFDFPDENGIPYKSSGGKMIGNEKLERDIPDGWQVDLLGNSLKTVLGGTPSTKVKKYWENASIPWLSSGETELCPVIDSIQKITHSGLENSAAELLPKGSVVISIVRYIRPSILAIDACTNQSVVGILESEMLKNYYIYPYIVNEVPRLMSIRTGAQQPHINKASIDDTLLIIPPEELLQKYYGLVEPIYRKIFNIAFENDELVRLRDLLLPMLMNGQVTIRNNEEVQKAVATDLDTTHKTDGVGSLV